ncbi:kinesin-like protein KIF19 isoform X2 [Cimex lectularius]|uniref:Kinesin motor domain-containing protein n=1 Tax=Cimex lectularius TaxID=79782 RepID=A0A8I6SLJ0_CIMLE|nr:kinesin-like protein KIF19 isoform X2 [Cimex lectularius]
MPNGREKVADSSVDRFCLHDRRLWQQIWPVKGSRRDQSSVKHEDMHLANGPSNGYTPQNNTQGTDEKLMVAVRVRPLKQDEGERIIHVIDDHTIVLDDETDKKDVLRHKRPSDKQYTYDFAFGENSTQEEVYAATTRGLVRDVLLGYNATVFAYGATGAGKTHTMVGTAAQPGIMVRALNDLFTSVSNDEDKYQVKMSYLELYNENIRDLLNPTSGFLELREDSGPLRTPTVAGLTEIEATSTHEVMGLLLRGNKERTIEPTAANKTSSRSHALLSVTVVSEEGEDRRKGKLYMLDLAGSERASVTKNRGKRLLEGAHINRSLLALGNVINALSGNGGGTSSSGNGGRYVNYRDSKLTRLLRNALSGNCRTVMVGHVSPSSIHKDETKNTLIYASRAARITHKVEKNELEVGFQVSQYREIISDLRSEIGRLKNKLTESRPTSADIRGRTTGTPVKQLREQIIATFREQMKLRRRLMDIDGHLMSLGVEAERQHQIISQWEARRSKLYNRARPHTSAEEGGEVSIHDAWSELSYIEREQERYVALRSATLKELDATRQNAVALENLDSETEREMLSLLIRVHELEADKVAMQGERLVETHELRRRADMLQRFYRQQRLTDEIITRQRHLIEEGKIQLPNDLQDLYSLYQQEIHATTFSTDTAGIPYTAYDTLPPIKEVETVLSRRGYTAMIPPTADSEYGRTSTGGSSSSDWELPKLANSQNHVTANEPLPPIPQPILFPPISRS